jgi:hypothetical protein
VEGHDPVEGLVCGFLIEDEGFKRGFFGHEHNVRVRFINDLPIWIIDLVYIGLLPIQSLL